MYKVKQKYFIDTHKGLTPLFILYLINYYNQWDNMYAMLYLALHGSYGLLWITKSMIYPDKQWESKIPIWYGFVIWGALSLYWISPYIISTGNYFINYGNSQLFNKIFVYDTMYIFFCVTIFIFGIFLHFTSDMQKYISLKLNPGHLITDKMFSRIRNTNYLGELFIYLGFTLLAKDFLPLFGLFLIIVFVWIPNIIKKDKSLSKYPEFSEYKRKTSRMFPFLF